MCLNVICSNMISQRGISWLNAWCFFRFARDCKIMTINYDLLFYDKQV